MWNISLYNELLVSNGNDSIFIKNIHTRDLIHTPAVVYVSKWDETDRL